MKDTTMKLHDLQVGQRFTFVDKHRCKTFEVTQRAPRAVHYTDTATGDERMAPDSVKAFRMDVEIEQPADRFTPDERKLLDEIFSTVYLLECDEENREDRKSAITALHLKITGPPGQ